MEETTLRDLLTRLGEDDREAARDLFAQVQVPLVRFFGRLCRDRDQIEDLIQNTCLKLWLYRGQYKGGGKARSYLYRVALNEWRNGYARDRRREDMQDDLRREYREQATKAPGGRLESEETIDHILTAIRSLPADQREVLVLHRFQGFSCREIAEVIGRSSKTVESRLRLALEKMTDKLSIRGGRP